MITLDAPRVPAEDANDIFGQARKSLSGKRMALVGASAAAMLEFTRVITDADGFTRFLSARQVNPSAELLKPFELILLDIEAAAGTAWLEAENLASFQERCIALGSFPSLLESAGREGLPFREYWPCSGPPEELLLRCVLGLRAGSGPVRRGVPAGSTVVLADDDTSVTAMVRRALERNGLNCEVAATGRDALALISKVKPCAAILDIHMPTIDGFEVLSQLKSSAELAQTRVILLTGCEQEADIIRGFSLGADDYVVKPFNPMELTIRLMRVIGRI
jgi:CheY-like chemotaxis protein